MVGFGRQLADSANQEWLEFYLDYGSLKRSINDCRQAQQAAAQQPGLSRLLDARKAIFQGQLDAEVLKVVGFYKKQSQQLLQEVARVEASVREALDSGHLASSADRLSALDAQADALQALIHRTTLLLQYVGLNMTAIRKILKKYSKNVNQQLNEPIAGFLALEVEHPDDPGWRVLQGTFLPAAVADDLHRMQGHGELVEAMGKLQQLFEDARERRRQLLSRPSLEFMPSQEEHVLGAIADSVEAMQSAQEDAARDAALVHAVPWVERAAGMFEPPPPDRFAVATRAGLVLNSLSTLLFMANYTAVLPPTDALCVHIGVPPSFTGYIMAASDLAAVFTSVGISYWTQRSFKQPLIFSAAACLIGNVLFVLSYQRRSLATLLLARLFNGLGSARTANRRYTADYVSKAQRTKASAAFVACSNLGMALGPLLSLPLAYVPHTQLLGLPVTPITAVGYIMAACWAVFAVCTFFLFKGPSRRLPIGLARASMVLPTTATIDTPREAPSRRRGSSGGRLAGSGDSARSLQQLRQPLLATVRSGEAPTDEELAGGLYLEQGLEPAGSVLPDSLPRTTASQYGTPHQTNQTHQGQADQPAGPALHRGAAAAAAAAAAAWKATIPGTVACTLCLFVQKMVQQSYLDSLPTFTDLMYGWGSSQKGIFLGTVSLAMVPVNLAVGALSAYLSDRSMVLGSLLLCMACLLALMLSAASTATFFGGGVLLYMGTVVLEGTATSLMSKCIWRGFATGVLNAGLLSTEAGTLGRFAGNALLAVAGKLTGLGSRAELAHFTWVMHGTLAAVCAALLVHLGCNYSRLKG